jgi:hypothetical protein
MKLIQLIEDMMDDVPPEDKDQAGPEIPAVKDETQIGPVVQKLGFKKTQTRMFAFGAMRQVTVLSKNEKIGNLNITLQYVINPATGAWTLSASLAGQPIEKMIQFENGEDPESLLQNLKKKTKITPREALQLTKQTESWELDEMLDTKATVTWHDTDYGFVGTFNYKKNEYEIHVDEYTLKLSSQLSVLDIGFTKNKSHLLQKTDSPAPIFGIIFNAVSEKIKEIKPDIVLFGVHYVNGASDKRKSIYEKIASWYAKGSSYFLEKDWIKSANGEYKILSRKRLTQEDLDSIIKLASNIPAK